MKSPSVFLKHIEFEQEYADFGLFALPVHVHTAARAFLVGRMIIDIRHANYQPVPFEIGAALLKINRAVSLSTKRKVTTMAALGLVPFLPASSADFAG